MFNFYSSAFQELIVAFAKSSLFTILRKAIKRGEILAELSAVGPSRKRIAEYWFCDPWTREWPADLRT